MSFFKVEESPKALYPVKVYIAPGSVLEVPPHFHITHDEIFTIEQGVVEITQNGVAKKYDASSGEITIPRGTIHSIHAKAPADEPIITWERTNPGDLEKELMFRVMNSVMLDSSVYSKTGKLGLIDTLQMNLTFYHCDGYMAILPTWMGAIGKKIDLVIVGVLAWVTSLAGYKPTYPEYVTDELYEAVKKMGKGL